MFYNSYFIEHLLATAYANFLALLCSTSKYAIEDSKMSLKESLKDKFVCSLENLVNPIHATGLFLYTLHKNIKLSDVSRGYRDFIAYLEALQGGVKIIWSLIFVL